MRQDPTLYRRTKLRASDLVSHTLISHGILRRRSSDGSDGGVNFHTTADEETEDGAAQVFTIPQYVLQRTGLQLLQVIGPKDPHENRNKFVEYSSDEEERMCILCRAMMSGCICYKRRNPVEERKCIVCRAKVSVCTCSSSTHPAEVKIRSPFRVGNNLVVGKQKFTTQSLETGRAAVGRHNSVGRQLLFSKVPSPSDRVVGMIESILGGGARKAADPYQSGGDDDVLDRDQPMAATGMCAVCAQRPCTCCKSCGKAQCECSEWKAYKLVEVRI